MSDNINVTEGAGKVVAADDIGGVLWQRVKIGVGDDGAAVDVSSTNPLPVTNTALGAVADGAYSGSGSGSVVAILKKLVAQWAAGLTISGSIGLSDAEGVKGQVGGMLAIATNGTSLTRPADTTAYAANDLVANSTTAGSVAYPALGSGGGSTPGRVSGGSFQIDRGRLKCSMTSGLAGVPFRVRLWHATSGGLQSQTYTNGDNGAYAVATGGANYIGSMTGVFEQFGDYAVAILTPDYGSISVKLQAGVQVMFWDMQTLAAFTPGNASSFALHLECKQD